MLKGNNTTQCYYGNWTGLTPWCKEGQASNSFVFIISDEIDFQFTVHFPALWRTERFC